MKARVAFLVVVWCLLLSTAAQAQSLPSAKPEEVGLSSERLGKLTARLKADVEKGVRNLSTRMRVCRARSVNAAGESPVQGGVGTPW
jgi:hypothetical protein